MMFYLNALRLNGDQNISEKPKSDDNKGGKQRSCGERGKKPEALLQKKKATRNYLSFFSPKFTQLPEDQKNYFPME